MRTVYLNASYFPAVELLSAIGTAAIILYGGYQAIDGKIEIGVVVAFIGYLQLVLRPDPADLAALHDLPAGDGGARQDLRPARHRPDMVDRPDAIDPGRLRGEIELDDVWFSYARGGDAGADETAAGRRRAGRSRGSTCTCRRARRWRWSARPGPASRRWRSWSRASTTRSAAGCWSTATTCATLSSSALRGQLGIVPQEGFLFSGTIRENIAFGRPDAEPGGDRRRGARRRRRGLRRPAAGRLRDRGRRARRAPLGRPAPDRRLRPGAARRAADPDPRRGDLERRRAHRAGDRGGARAAAARADGDRDRAPAVDDQARRADRRARARRGSPSRAPTRS